LNFSTNICWGTSNVYHIPLAPEKENGIKHSLFYENEKEFENAVRKHSF
jgi:hypothetical protein